MSGAAPNSTTRSAVRLGIKTVVPALVALWLSVQGVAALDAFAWGIDPDANFWGSAAASFALLVALGLIPIAPAAVVLFGAGLRPATIARTALRLRTVPVLAAALAVETYTSGLVSRTLAGLYEQDASAAATWLAYGAGASIVWLSAWVGALLVCQALITPRGQGLLSDLLFAVRYGGRDLLLPALAWTGAGAALDLGVQLGLDWLRWYGPTSAALSSQAEAWLLSGKETLLGVWLLPLVVTALLEAGGYTPTGRGPGGGGEAGAEEGPGGTS